MSKQKITLIQGHPDPQAIHFNHALADSYAEAAIAAGHEVRLIKVAELDFNFLHNEDEFQNGFINEDIKTAQEDILWAQHLVIIYPLWLGTMPAMLKAFLEQTLRPGFALSTGNRNKFPQKMLSGRSAHVIITMGMPAFIYKWFYFSHSLRNLKRNILKFCGISPVQQTLIGSIDNLSVSQRNDWLQHMRKLAANIP